jgi:hypothetical protein
VPALGPKGTSCFVSTDCAVYDDLTCLRDNPTSTMGTCQKWSRTGGTCQFSDDCVLGDYCDYSGTLTCLPQEPDGTSCMFSDQCQSAWCLNGFCTPPMGCILY